MQNEQRIPKTIHYCWFGGNPLPEMAVACIESWKRYCPDYEIVEWNETNFPIDYNDYVKEAYEAKKWAFVSDVARFKILYENGGVYFDTDVELIKPIDDIIEKGPFVGVENDGMAVAPGLGLAAFPKMEIYAEILDFYDSRRFILEDGSLDLTTVVENVTEIFESHGLKKKKCNQTIEGVTVYTKEYFCPKDGVTGKINITENTYSIHHYDSSWISEEKQYAKKFRERHRMPRFMAAHVSCFVAAWKFRGFSGAISETFGYFKAKNKKKKKIKEEKNKKR